MNIFQKIKLATTLNSDFNQMEQGMKTKNTTKVVTAGVALLAAVVAAFPQVNQYVGSHETVSAIITGIGAIVALFHDPKESQ